jgi:hypothetical protein
VRDATGALIGQYMPQIFPVRSSPSLDAVVAQTPFGILAFPLSPLGVNAITGYPNVGIAPYGNVFYATLNCSGTPLSGGSQTMGGPYLVGIWNTPESIDANNYYVNYVSPLQYEPTYYSLLESGLCNPYPNGVSNPAPGFPVYSPTPISTLGVLPFVISPK